MSTSTRAYFANGISCEVDEITGLIKKRPKGKPVKFYTSQRYLRLREWSLEQGLYENDSATGEVFFQTCSEEDYHNPIYMFRIELRATKLEDLKKLMIKICAGSIKPETSFDKKGPAAPNNASAEEAEPFDENSVREWQNCWLANGGKKYLPVFILFIFIKLSI